jgi:hypothetical protein
MFDNTSRYYSLSTGNLNVVTSAGTTQAIAYQRRRFLPGPDGMTTLAVHTVRESDRLDNVAAQYLGDPAQFWRICDANTTMQPWTLLSTALSQVRIAIPKL